jgi:flagellar biosynthesis protein FlhB
MSDAAEKHFEPTPSRIAKAKREGNVVRAQELSANLAFIASAAAACGIVPLVAAAERRNVELAASGASPVAGTAAVIGLALVPLLAAAAAGAAAAIWQSGGLFSMTVAPRFERLHPIEGCKRMLSRETATHAVRALAAFLLASIAMIPILAGLAAASSYGLPLAVTAGIAWSGARRAVAVAAGIGLLFALAEFAVARKLWLQRLRMSFEEFKREIKEHDGDPQARSRRKALHRDLLRGALATVKDAAFLIVNPTHVAIALEYRPPDVPVPAVLVRAADAMALQAREVANEHRVPVVENVALARALFADARVGDPIPHAHYVAVAEIVAALMRTGAIA